ncbi:hypothetical protein L596_005696 [Steinernema carpocapsae]|uniref:Uncharacterized protein n=1 Tax=Steinernema carpocapsae TaxID=34508 RepID=A0A4V6I8K5_STECR|nr:hypothetical protein L596_005696 [Steinernema carpocapsae]
MVVIIIIFIYICGHSRGGWLNGWLGWARKGWAWLGLALLAGRETRRARASRTTMSTTDEVPLLFRSFFPRLLLLCCSGDAALTSADVVIDALAVPRSSRQLAPA